MTAGASFAAPNETPAVRSLPRSGAAAPPPGPSAALTRSTAVLLGTPAT